MVTTLAGTVKNEAGTNQASLNCHVYNKTDEEGHNGDEGGNFANLITDANGDYTVDLEHFTATPTTGDIVFVQVWDRTTEKKGIGRISITSGSTNTLNLTIKEVEPEKAITHLLRVRIADPNTSRANAIQMVVPHESRLDSLGKSSFPRITVRKVNEKIVKRGGIGTNTRKQVVTVRVGVHVWAKRGDYQKLAGTDSVNREGNILLSYLSRKISDVLEERFFVNDPLQRDSMIKDFFEVEDEDFISDNAPADFDEESGFMSHYLSCTFYRLKISSG